MFRVGLKSYSACSIGKRSDPPPGSHPEANSPSNPTNNLLDPSNTEETRKATSLTRALRSHQLWLTITYFGLLLLMARGFAS